MWGWWTPLQQKMVSRGSEAQPLELGVIYGVFLQLPVARDSRCESCWIHAYMHADIHACIHIYIYIHIHIHIHIYIYMLPPPKTKVLTE